MALIDQYNLAQNVLFQNRVRQSLATTSAAVYNETQTTAGHGKRAALAQTILNNPTAYVVPFAVYVAGDTTVATQAGTVTSANADTQQALVTDAAINNAVSAIWNAVAGA